ncbi:hypothetical protein DACRYDRAFT_112701 [Dacryopinax primogenitus]|uniref:Uncharacterized protein n=1 Tax=Dacryopinax primogenitus (strain DJM 731) TaxID=1858805 RepID=M5FNQ5_DACPD|nr:uncharacterized protein DACRYDRAFT_112701 [Dacryopinax primogenitus]EJT96503.1 hypothetical protein DACRYDRAFT_112701 [Dacryopinax primogenitus]
MLELPEFTVAGDFAAIMHANNSTLVNPHSILIWRLGDDQPSYISILSQHYELLQYPLLFPHGTLGWGIIENNGQQARIQQCYVNAYGVTQCQWYFSCLITEDQFLNFG